MLDSRIACTRLPMNEYEQLTQKAKLRLRYRETWVVLVGGQVLNT